MVRLCVNCACRMGFYASFEETIQSLVSDYGFRYSKFVQRPTDNWPKVFAFEESDDKFVYENKVTESDQELFNKVIAKFGYVLIDINISPCSYICICAKRVEDGSKIHKYTMGYYIDEPSSLNVSEVFATYLIKEHMGEFLGRMRIIHGRYKFNFRLNFGLNFGREYDSNLIFIQNYFDNVSKNISYMYDVDPYFIISPRGWFETVIKFEGLISTDLNASLVELLRTKHLTTRGGKLSSKYVYSLYCHEVI